jgi:cytochrome c peroxidase
MFALLRYSWITFAGIALLAACTGPSNTPSEKAAYTISAANGALIEAGKAIFFDKNLSIKRNQSCAACHDPAYGFTGPDSVVNAGGGVYEGSIPGRYGNRKPPSSAYATLSPILHIERGARIGGNFWDGRATGKVLGNPAADQAQGPFLNPAEQGLRDAACVVYRVSIASYAKKYATAQGRDIFAINFPPSIDAECAREGPQLELTPAVRRQVQREYDRIAIAIAAYEGSPEVNSFTSKFDAARMGKATLSHDEQLGFSLFQDKCARCHPASGQQALFTDFSYDNLGVPVNPQNPAYIASGFIDRGLGAFLNDPGENGKVRVPTLRNVDRRPFPGALKSFTHNGVFRTLEQVVHFYNTRDVLARCAALADPGFGKTCWPSPEVAQNLNRKDVGNLGLTAEQERQIVAFLRTLSDGYF